MQESGKVASTILRRPRREWIRPTVQADLARTSASRQAPAARNCPPASDMTAPIGMRSAERAVTSRAAIQPIRFASQWYGHADGASVNTSAHPTAQTAPELSSASTAPRKLRDRPSRLLYVRGGTNGGNHVGFGTPRCSVPLHLPLPLREVVRARVPAPFRRASGRQAACPGTPSAPAASPEPPCWLTTRMAPGPRTTISATPLNNVIRPVTQIRFCA